MQFGPNGKLKIDPSCLAAVRPVNVSQNAPSARPARNHKMRIPSPQQAYPANRTAITHHAIFPAS